MRSLLLRILLASLGTILASLVASVATLAALIGPVNERLIQHFQARQIEELVDALARGGPVEVSRLLRRLDASLGATHHLVDSRGIDVVTAEDRSPLLALPRPFFGPPRAGNNVVVVVPSPDRRYRLITSAPPPLDAWAFVPHFAVILAAIGLFCWLLARTIVTPLQGLAAAVKQFGRGELATRVPTMRRDEIGQLTRAFNEMATRIETLLIAERRLLQDISHELRSPLARLNIGIELSRTAENRDDAATRLQKEVDRLTRLVGSLLEVTRVEGDPSTRRTEPVVIADLLNEVAESCALEADARPCQLVVDATRGRVLFGDAELLRRALENIVRNAIRYAPPGSNVELRVEDGPSELVVTIRDVGAGVPEELLPRLAQPFFRAEDARDYSPTGGVGLGLSIAQRAVRLHQGTLLAENAHPGLRVTVTLPAAPTMQNSYKS
jgi:signal transduction histidine kinase